MNNFVFLACWIIGAGFIAISPLTCVCLAGLSQSFGLHEFGEVGLVKNLLVNFQQIITLLWNFH